MQFQKVIASVYQGEDKTFIVELGECHNLTLATEIIAEFMKTDSTVLSKKLSTHDIAIIDALTGKFSVALTAADTALLMPGEVMPIEFKMTVSTKVDIEQRSIEVITPAFP